MKVVYEPEDFLQYGWNSMESAELMSLTGRVWKKSL
jgi:hypothetical protein